MAELDYVVKSLTVKSSSVFKIDDLYKVLKSTLADLGYKVSERDYKDTDKKHIEVKFICFKVIDDYSMFMIEVKLKVSNIEHISIKGKRLQKADAELKFESYIQSDYEDFWEEKGTSKFLRGIYDKFTRKNKFDKYEDQLKEDTYDVYDEIKSYLKLHVLK